MQFTIRTILLAMVFLAAAMGTFATSTGTFGVVLGLIMGIILLCACISIKYAHCRGYSIIVRVAIWAGILTLFITMFQPSIARIHASGLRSRCADTMKQLAIGIANYQNDHGQLPPICTVDDAGQPLHSWRTLLLPYLGEKSLYSKIDLTSSWDSNTNKPLTVDGPEVFQCLAAFLGRRGADENNLSDKTDYVTVVGKGTMWPSDGQGEAPPIADPANTIMLIEIGDSNIHWNEPRDLSLDEVINPQDTENRPFANFHNRFEQYRNDRPDLWFFHLMPGPYHVVTADGRVHQLPEIPSREELIALFDPGPKSIDIEAISKRFVRPRPRWSAIMGLAIMLASYIGIFCMPLWPPQERYTKQNEKSSIA